MLLRVALLCLLITCRGGSYVIEQPNTSSFLWHPAIEFLKFRNSSCPVPYSALMPKNTLVLKPCKCNIYKVYIHKWWMMHWGGATPKRHVCLTNNVYGKKFDRGTLTRKQKELLDTGIRTTIKYQDAGGRSRYVGSRHLKKTQPQAELLRMRSVEPKTYRSLYI